MIIEIIIICIALYMTTYLIVDAWDDELRRKHDRWEAEFNALHPEKDDE